MAEYYHVIVRSKSDTLSGEYKTDLTRGQLYERFIAPYENGEPIQINGKTVHLEELDRITVAESDVPIEDLKRLVVVENLVSHSAFGGGTTVGAICKARDITDEILAGPPGYKRNMAERTVVPDSVNHNDVFIVHGHNEAAKTKVARFLEKLGLSPVILHEKASSGKTILEKIEAYANVGYSVVIYTADDVGNKLSLSKELRPRARQNVIFEHGFLAGRIGRDRVAALVENDVELPNDISGVVYIPLDDADGWHLGLAKELKQAGYAIDVNNLM